MKICINTMAWIWTTTKCELSLQWRHNGHDNISNHQPHDCLFNRLFRRRSKKTSKLSITGLCAGNSPGRVNSPHKWPVTRKMFPFDDVIMFWIWTVSVKVISEKGAKPHWFFGWLIWAAERKCSITQCNCCNFGWVSWQLEIKCSFDIKVMCLFILCGRSCP